MFVNFRVEDGEGEGGGVGVVVGYEEGVVGGWFGFWCWVVGG